MSDVIHLQPDGSYAFPPTTEPLPELPAPRLPGAGVEIRAAVQDDFGFIDDLQKRHKDGVGFMWEKAIRGHITKGNVLVAEATGGVGSSDLGVGERHAAAGETRDGQSSPTPNPQNPTPSPAKPVGYVLGVDRYLKRDELGVIYQMCVEPEFQRSLVAANLLKAKFERSAYGCRLYCCWCAQDLAANRFWEAMGFVPLAFRTGGGRKKGFDEQGNYRGRVHIFWQKRIRQGDHGPGHPDTTSGGGGTAYWFPSITGAGAIGEDRIVLPIPPGTHWSDTKPIVLPEGPTSGGGAEVKLLESEVQRLERDKRQAVKAKRAKAVSNAMPEGAIEAGGLRFGTPPEVTQAKRAAEAEVDEELKAAKRAVNQAKKKFDPAQEAFARELKDRWLEQVLAEPKLLASGGEKYNVGRRIESTRPRAGRSESETMRVVGTNEPKRLDAA